MGNEIVVRANVPGFSELTARKKLLLLATIEKHNPPPAVLVTGPLAIYAWDEFFEGEVSNALTRKAYEGAVRRFLSWCQSQDLSLRDLMPGHIREYLTNRYPDSKKQISTRNNQLAPIRKFLDKCVQRHAMVLNPCTSIRGEKLKRTKGLTPEISAKDAKKLLRSISGDSIIDLRDRAILATLMMTGRRIGAVCATTLSDFRYEGSQWKLRFIDKNGDDKLLPIRHDLEEHLRDYFEVAGVRAGETGPVFLSVKGKTGTYAETPLSPGGARRMLKKRLVKAKLDTMYSPHSFRVMVGTSLCEQKVPIEDVQELLGHADARTTKLYDRSDREITRNLVERIPV